jgi:PadR family transcriptional regulator, regulatory protein AphA
MSLEYSILGFLNYQPYSGYNLKKIFDSTIHHFWSADQSQIYRTLIHLSDSGFIEMERVPQDDRPDKKVYRITDSGRMQLKNWLAGPVPDSNNRSSALVQVFFSAQLRDEEVLARFESYAEALRVILARYELIPSELTPYDEEIDSPRERFFWLLTLENGICSIRANLQWAESVIARIRSGSIPQA